MHYSCILNIECHILQWGNTAFIEAGEFGATLVAKLIAQSGGHLDTQNMVFSSFIFFV